MPSAEAKPRRLFLALWPSPAEQLRLAELGQFAPGGRRIKPANLHLTLAFLGATGAEQLDCYQHALQDIAVPTLTLLLDRFGFWPKPGILWLAPSQSPPALKDLVSELNRRLQDCGYTPDRRPFSAHVTLARQYAGPWPKANFEPFAWTVDRIALVESLNTPAGVHYQVLNYWPAGTP